MNAAWIVKAADRVLWKIGLARKQVLEQHVRLAVEIDRAFKRMREADTGVPRSEPDRPIDQMVDEYLASRYVGLRVRRDTNGELRATKGVQP